MGLLSEEKWVRFQKKHEAVEKELNRLKSTWVTPDTLMTGEAERVLGTSIEREYSLAALISRPKVTYKDVATLKRATGENVSRETLDDAAEIEQIEIALKYQGYIDRQAEEIKRAASHEQTRIPEDIDYDAVSGLSFEVRQHLKRVRPATLGQAGRISGVTPAAISLLLVHLKRLKWGKS
jgi:tRNA uridine 5-carboxymethylaminomethyl modification enzyme